jgi:uncharacterized membrane protein
MRIWSDERLERVIGTLLRAGVLTAAAVVLTGGIIYLARHGGQTPAYHVFRGEPTDLRSVAGILRDVAEVSGRGVIQFGLLLLIATPVARVVLSVAIFALERDVRYVGITLLVLSVLLYSLAVGYV